MEDRFGNSNIRKLLAQGESGPKVQCPQRRSVVPRGLRPPWRGERSLRNTERDALEEGAWTR
jgi:hypothetical protein